MTDTDVRVNHVHELVPRHNVVSLSPATARRLNGLAAQARLAADLQQQTHKAFVEAITGIFEDAGLVCGEQDNFRIDWQHATMTLRPAEAV
jgi:galactokinase